MRALMLFTCLALSLNAYAFAKETRVAGGIELAPRGASINSSLNPDGQTVRRHKNNFAHSQQLPLSAKSIHLQKNTQATENKPREISQEITQSSNNIEQAACYGYYEWFYEMKKLGFEKEYIKKHKVRFA